MESVHQHMTELKVPTRQPEPSDFLNPDGKKKKRIPPKEQVKTEAQLPDSGPVADEEFWERILSLFPH